MSHDSHIVVSDGKCVAYVGTDAVSVVRAFTLWSALGLYINSGGRILPTRGVGITKMLALASQITGKKYRRNEAHLARDDVKVWADEMKAALPVVKS